MEFNILNGSFPSKGFELILREINKKTVDVVVKQRSESEKSSMNAHQHPPQLLLQNVQKMLQIDLTQNAN